ncbi:hypothetical protein BFW01_g2231 [Lasiodiplodia theobromae]|nr:hypothetical protein BFW01_g2231 [Lasiodiplodia theobromae]
MDGKQAPQVYLTDHLITHRNDPNLEISPVVAINGEETARFLTDFAALNSFGLVEPHADWNSLMSRPPQDILGEMNTFSTSALFYPGEDLTFTLENGTALSTPWVAFYNDQGCTGPLSTPGDFYNFFVLGLLPASYDNSNCTKVQASIESDSDYLRSWSSNSYDAYPTHADIVQANLSIDHGGVVTGYFLHDISVAVLSIPSFYQFSDDSQNFARAVQSFIDGASAAAMSRVIIDLQQNSGGAIFLAIDTFKRFFPNIEPFAGSRRRSHPLADELGEVSTNWWGTLDRNDPATEIYLQHARDEWVITNRLNAETDKTFSSWSEYYGPRSFNGDAFSEIERYNLSDYSFDLSAFGDVPYSYNSSDKPPSSGEWLPEDIVILTDGLCSSACSLFVEMMKTQAGVHTIVMGGRPEVGPMQYASGSRGARDYSTYELGKDFEFASSKTDNTTTILPQAWDSGMFILYAGFNLRDQIRENGTVPLQFLYEPANCRLYYTVDNIYNMSQLWQDVATAAWNDSSMCVQGSVNLSSSDFNFTVSAQSILDELSIEMPNMDPDDFDATPSLSITDAKARDLTPKLQNSPCQKNIANQRNYKI